MKRKIIYIMLGILLFAPFAQAHALCNGDFSLMKVVKAQDENTMDCHQQKNKNTQSNASICDFTCALGLGISQPALEQYSESKPQTLQLSKIHITPHPAYSENLYRPPA